MRKTDPPGSVDWIREALDRYEGALVRYATRLLGNLDSARDVVQDVFLRLCSENPTKVRDHLAPWLFTVCRNRALDVMRKENRMNSLEDAALEVLESGDPSPAERLEHEETTNHVLALLGRLPLKQQEVIRLKFQEGLSYREISQITGNTVTNVGVLIHTGMKTIRERLAQTGARA